MSSASWSPSDPPAATRRPRPGGVFCLGEQKRACRSLLRCEQRLGERRAKASGERETTAETLKEANESIPMDVDERDGAPAHLARGLDVQVVARLKEAGSV